MSINFPTIGVGGVGIGSTYGFGTRVWTYNGEGWQLVPKELPQGPQGVQGTQGISGEFAGQGTQGSQGTQGLQGIIGAQGTQGTQGLSNQGVQGTIGSQGTQGTSPPPGGSGTFDVGISSSVYVSVTSGVGINTEQTNNILVGPGTACTFSSNANFRYVVESIHVCNKYSADLFLSATHDYSDGIDTPIAQRVIVPYQGATELLVQPIVANPSDVLKLQALSGVGTTAVGVDGGLDAFIVYSEKEDTNYVGVGTTVPSTVTDQEIFNSSSNPSVIQSIRLINYNLSVDLDASISVYRNTVRLGYLVYNITVPKNSVIEILDKPKYLNQSESIRAVSSVTNGLSVCVSGKYIV